MDNDNAVTAAADVKIVILVIIIILTLREMGKLVVDGMIWRRLNKMTQMILRRRVDEYNYTSSQCRTYITKY